MQSRISSPQEAGRGGQPMAFAGGQQRENQGKHITFFTDSALPLCGRRSAPCKDPVLSFNAFRTSFDSSSLSS